MKNRDRQTDLYNLATALIAGHLSHKLAEQDGCHHAVVRDFIGIEYRDTWTDDEYEVVVAYCDGLWAELPAYIARRWSEIKP